MDFGGAHTAPLPNILHALPQLVVVQEVYHWTRKGRCSGISGGTEWGVAGIWVLPEFGWRTGKEVNWCGIMCVDILIPSVYPYPHH